MHWAQIPIANAPPTAGETENRFRPQLRRGHVHENQRTARSEQIVQVTQGSANVGYGVKYVGADDKIERADLEALFGSGFFKIKDPGFNFREVCELLMGTREESSRDVGECVGVQAALQRREHLRAEAASTGADFEDPQAAALRKHTGRFLHSSADSCKPVTCQQTVAVKLVEQF